MRKDDLIRMQHMLEAVKEALSFTRGKQRKDLDSDRMLTLSIIKAIEIIGEAASKVTELNKCKKIFRNSLSPLYLKDHNDFFDGHRTSPPVPFGPPTLTLSLGGGREGWG